MHNWEPRCGTFNGCFLKDCATGASDTQLLGRFASNRDEAAFAAIMARHGPMVMTVCQGVLRDSPDAEDAFQATFLVLARKAGSAWAQGQLGGWLHRVAYRVAVRASKDAARRRRHERQAAQVAATGLSQVSSDDEIRLALHEELARLPAKLRAPLVLCYLEGQTHARAALELRCGEATLRRRLALARQRLRSRLVRRGFAPTASVAVLSMAGEAKAVPSAVAQTTLRAAVRVAAGEAVAVVAGTRKAGLTKAGSNVLTQGRNTLAQATLGLAAIACAAAGIGVLGNEHPGGSTRAGIEAPRHPQAQAVAETRPRKTGSQKHSIKGTVLAPDGKPMAGATVFWVGQPRPEPIALATPLTLKERPVDLLKIFARAATDAQGQFELTAEFDAHSFPGGAVVVKATDAGVSGRTFFNDKVSEGAGNDQRLTIRLRKTVTIEGRLLAASGAPAKGVKVSLASIEDGEYELESNRVSLAEVAENDRTVPDFWPGSWITDNDGRFRIEGIVPEQMVARLRFRHPDFADDDLWVSAGPPPEKWLRWMTSARPAEARFTHTLQPARPVTGIASDKDSGKPLGGVLIQMLPLRVKKGGVSGSYPVTVMTDASGRYRASCEAGDSCWITAFPDGGSGYLPLHREISWPVGVKVLNVDLALPRGRIVRGRVVEGKQGWSVKGASVIYQPAPRNPLDQGDFDFDNPVLTDKDGKFAAHGAHWTRTDRGRRADCGLYSRRSHRA